MPEGAARRRVPVWSRAALLAAVIAALAPTAPGAAGPTERPVRGGVLRVAHSGEPPTIDLHWTSGAPTQDVAIHIFEGLFALSSRYEPHPLLVDRWQMTPDRRTYTFTLRRGVRFHHGSEMTADDVVASLQRWGQVAARGRELFRQVESLVARDAYTVQMRLREANGLVPLGLAIPSQGAVVYPREVIDEAAGGPIRRFIGTGPYRFTEHVPDVRIRLERFDGYVPRDDTADGMAGRREAYLDAIEFLPVPDASVRIAGVIRGDYHFAHSVPTDEYARLRATRAVVPLVITTPQWAGFMFNHRSALMASLALRRAIVSAIDEEAALRGTYGPRQFWRATPSFFPREHPMWTEAGAAIYRQRDLTVTRRLLAEADYRNQPIRWMASSEMPHHLTAATIVKSQLETAGLVVDLQVMDWATLVSRRSRPEGWDVFTTTFGFVPDPVFLLPLSPAWPGWYQDREMQAYLGLLSRHADPRVRAAIWARAQQRFYERAVAVRLGDWFPLLLHRAELRGVVGGPGTFHWNEWISRSP
ncbi:MAG: ABC transporter substrate-binding protein [Armatimonadota bacterium]|nr:ABC transporter substrate-binding protein [Armatimonadota bacterium]